MHQAFEACRQCGRLLEGILLMLDGVHGMNRLVYTATFLALLASCAADQGAYDYGSTNPRALRDYNAGWP